MRPTYALPVLIALSMGCAHETTPTALYQSAVTKAGVGGGMVVGGGLGLVGAAAIVGVSGAEEIQVPLAPTLITLGVSVVLLSVGSWLLSDASAEVALAEEARAEEAWRATLRERGESVRE